MKFLDDKVELRKGDCRAVLRAMPDNSIDSVVTDPPYALVSIVKRFGKPGSAPVKVNEFYQENGESKGASPYVRARAGFMGKQWDTGETAFAVEFWAEVLRVLKPGGHVVAFSGTRTYHRMACAIEDAGFEIRDQLQWLYGSGFPKSHDVSKAIDKAAGAEREVLGVIPDRWTGKGNTLNFSTDRPQSEVLIRSGASTDAAKQWEGWGSALKPACEPICLARKPLIGTIAQNVLTHGTGAINIDGCRVGDFVNTTAPGTDRYNAKNHELGYRPNAYGRDGEASADKRYTDKGSTNFAATPGPRGGDPSGRFPANVIHDGSDEVVRGFPHSSSGTGAIKQATAEGHQANAYGKESRPAGTPMICHGDEGSASRFFYTSKADGEDRLGSKHPTVKPLDLMQYLVRLVTRKGGVVLDPFAGTGTTGEAAWREGMSAILIEREPEYQADIARRMELATNPTKRAAIAKTKNNLDDPNSLPLFASFDLEVPA